MTNDHEREFERQWPALSARVNALLRRKKISPWLAEDLTQETGLRLIRMWPKIDKTQPIWPLVATITLNLMRDEMRRSGSHELTCSVPDAPSLENVERRGMARLELRAVGGALSQMADTQRHVLLAEVSEEPSDAPDPSATRMLRMRARRKLQSLMDHASLLGIALGDHLRRVVRQVELAAGRVLPINAENVSAAAISLLAALSLGIAIAPDTHSEAGEPGSPGSSVTREGWTGGRSGAEVDALSNGSRRGLGSARDGRLSLRDRRDGSTRGASDGDTGGGNTGEPFPGAVEYWARVNDDTYVSGSANVEVVGDDDIAGRDGSQPTGTGSVSCTVSPAHQGASCSHSGEGWSERGVRANHEGRAVVAGKRIY